MKYSLWATSIIESMIVLLVVVTGITWVYWLLISSQKLANSTSKRIEAIQIARDGLEAFINIRDTNWTLFAADYDNCWNTLNYNDACIWIATTATDMRHWGNQWYKIYRDSENKFRLVLWSYAPGDAYNESTYRNLFQVQKEASWFYTQSGGILYWVNGTPFYTREIRLDYKNSSWVSVWPSSSNNDSVEVNVIVQWNDSAKDEPQKLEMSTLLTNWKAKK